jgi:hypothetical protein
MGENGIFFFLCAQASQDESDLPIAKLTNAGIGKFNFLRGADQPARFTHTGILSG